MKSSTFTLPAMDRRTVMLAGLSLPLVHGIADAQQSVSMQDLAWVFWHEGTRLFDDAPGANMRPLAVLRNEWMSRQGQNGAARAAFSSTSDAQLVGLLGQVPAYVASDLAVGTHFDWTAQHEHQLAIYRDLVNTGQYVGIRRIYAQKQGRPNQHNLLAAMSNSWIQQRVASL